WTFFSDFLKSGDNQWGIWVGWLIDQTVPNSVRLLRHCCVVGFGISQATGSFCCFICDQLLGAVFSKLQVFISCFCAGLCGRYVCSQQSSCSMCFLVVDDVVVNLRPMVGRFAGVGSSHGQAVSF
ncbi:hypothetical protein, partial [Alcaligenes faecalis]|uniref:hypothetical protein n=1 Tax=Alcaligenes faecalis TaxID=511 RepID=UPI001969EA0E